MNNDNTITENGSTTAEAENTRSGRFFRPPVDILEGADELVVHADMPGTSADSIDIDFKDGTLTIHGRVASRQEEGARYLVQEFGVGDFHRTFQVSEQIDASRISADYRNGVLTLNLPKAEVAKPRKIAVKANR